MNEALKRLKFTTDFKDLVPKKDLKQELKEVGKAKKKFYDIIAVYTCRLFSCSLAWAKT